MAYSALKIYSKTLTGKQRFYSAKQHRTYKKHTQTDRLVSANRLRVMTTTHTSVPNNKSTARLAEFLQCRPMQFTFTQKYKFMYYKILSKRYA